MKTMICGIPFDIIMREKTSPVDQNYGLMSGKEARIYLDAKVPKPMREATLVHEWMHAVFECNGIQHEEVQVAVMATELYRNGFRVKVEK